MTRSEIINITATGTDRLDVLIASTGRVTRSRAVSLIDSGFVAIEGEKHIKASLKPHAGTQITLTLPPPGDCDIQAEDIPITIVYQDNDIAVINKPAGMVVHPAAGNLTHTLVNALLYHLPNLSGIGGQTRPGIVHRLDKDTSGLLIVAKNDAAHVNLSGQFQKREMEKTYYAVVDGVMKAYEGRIDMPIKRSTLNRKKMAADPGGRPSLTNWSLVRNLRGAAYVRVKPVTGRTHQIRVHFAAMHHPVAGDTLYGLQKSAVTSRLMLHAGSICFTHPATGERLVFQVDPPKDFLAVLASLEP
ncbi:MAG: RluA family pseudouridine synthase [Clostridia bacterium]|nr:RluA family pseudouridine synthase [Clostridia bacterium]